MSAEPREHHTHVEHYDGHTIAYDEEDGAWGAYVEDLPVCFSVGATFEECSRRIKEAIPLYLDAARDHEQQGRSAAS